MQRLTDTIILIVGIVAMVLVVHWLSAIVDLASWVEGETWP